jgi:hypothetical protein
LDLPSGIRLFSRVPNFSAATSAFPDLFFFTDIGATCLGEGCQAATLREAEDIPLGRNVTQWGIIEDLSIARRNHGLKLGVNFRRDDVVTTDRVKVKFQTSELAHSTPPTIQQHKSGKKN